MVIRVDAGVARCELFSFKEGLLSRLAHDLHLEVGRFTLEIADDQRSLSASFEPASIRVIAAVVGGHDDHAVLSAGDREKIRGNLLDDVLEAKRFPEIRFRSTRIEAAPSGLRIEGDLSLHGVTRRIEAVAVESPGSGPSTRRWACELSLHQPDFGIKPYSAALGALRVQAGVKVRVSTELTVHNLE